MLIAGSFGVRICFEVPHFNKMGAKQFDNNLTEIDKLRDALSKLRTNDPLLRSFAGLPVMTHAFFPGGNGLYQGIEATRIPVGGF